MRTNKTSSEDRVDKIAFFDMDGTITGDFDYDKHRGTTAWSRIARSISEKAYAEKCRINEEWYNDNIQSYTSWVDRTVNLYRDHGLSESTYKNVIKSLEYNEGVVEAFEELNKYNLKTVILTGGLRFQSTIVKKKLGIDHAVAACELEWEDGNISGYNVIPLNSVGKRSMMDIYKRSMSGSQKRCVTTYVGDGKNDVESIRNADLGIAYDGHEELDTVADLSLGSSASFTKVSDRLIEFYDNCSDR